MENAEEGTRLVFPGDMDMVEDLDKVRVMDNVEDLDKVKVMDNVEDLDKMKVMDSVEDLDKVRKIDRMEDLARIMDRVEDLVKAGIMDKVEDLDKLMGMPWTGWRSCTCRKGERFGQIGESVNVDKVKDKDRLGVLYI
jgi:hypothetical protein